MNQENIFDEQRRVIYFELKRIGLEESECWAEADLILKHVTRTKRPQQIISDLNHFETDWLQEITRIINLRQERKPLAYCLGEIEFAGLMFRIVPGVLIPRPDTETLIEAVIARLRRGGLHSPVRSDISRQPLRPLKKKSSDEIVGAKFTSPFVATSSEETGSADEQKNKFDLPLHIADIGIGCGAIAIALLKRLSKCTVWACDISELAINCALGNARRHNVHDRLTLVHGDWKKVLPTDFDVIVSNPPYLALSAQKDLQAEIAFEPKTALFDGSEDGLGFYRQFAEKLPAHFANPGGCNPPLQKNKPFAAFEIGDKQDQAVLDIFKQHGWQDLSSKSDVNGLSRAFIATPPN